MNPEENETLADKIEEKHGAIALLKGVCSAFSAVLVSKNVCTAEELREAFEEWASRYDLTL